MENINDYYT